MEIMHKEEREKREGESDGEGMNLLMSYSI